MSLHLIALILNFTSAVAYLYIIEGRVLRRPPLWSSGQSFWLQIQRLRVRSPALPDFLSIRGSGTGSIQPREPREFN